MSNSITVSVDVDIDLSDIDIEDMIEYLEDNGYEVIEESEKQEQHERQYEQSDYIANEIKRRFLDLDKNFMHDFLSELSGVQKSSSKEDILNRISHMM